MRRDDTQGHRARRALLPILAALLMLAAAGVGAQNIDPNDRYTLAGKAIAPKVAQSITWGIVGAVTARAETVGSLQATMERLEEAGVVRYGLPKLTSRPISSHGVAPPAEGEIEVNGAHGTLWGFGFTGGGDYRRLGSGADARVAWEGDSISGHLGFDIRPIREMLAGISAGVSMTNTTYEADGEAGLLDVLMVTGSPYFSWMLSPGIWWWATATYGRGEATIRDGRLSVGEAPNAGDATLLSGALGWHVTVVDGPGYDPASRLGLAVKGEGSLNEFQVARTRGSMPNLHMHTWRGRVLLQGTYLLPVNDSVSITPTLETGVRYDGGEAASGAGVEIGGSLRYDDHAVGVTLEARGRALVPLDDSSQEWGAGALVRISSDRDGYGPFLNVSPSYGAVDETIASAPPAAALIAHDGGRLNAEMGYSGLQVDGVPGLLTPYGAVTLGDGGASSYRWGSRLALTDDLDLNLEAQHERANIASATTHRAVVSANLRM